MGGLDCSEMGWTVVRGDGLQWEGMDCSERDGLQ